MVRGGWGQRAEQDKPRNLGDPFGWIRSNVFAESIRRLRLTGKSDAFVVARKGVTILERRDAAVG